MKLMHGMRWHRLAACFLLSLTALGSQAQAGGTPPPIADFFRAPDLTRVALSPDGKQLAAVLNQPGKRGALIVVDIVDPSKSRVVAALDDADVHEIHWVNSKRLVFNVFDGLVTGVAPFAPGLWGVDADGSNYRQLISAETMWGNFKSNDIASRTADRVLPPTWALNSVLDDGSDDVLVLEGVYDASWDLRQTRLFRLNTRTGQQRRAVDNTPDYAKHWWADRNGKALAVLSEKDDRSTLRMRRGDAWAVVQEGNVFTGTKGGFSPMGSGYQGELWMVGADPEGKVDTDVLLQMDLKQPEAKPKVLLSLPGYDFNGAVLLDRLAQRAIGVRFETDAIDTVWLDPAMKALQAEIDKQLPYTVNSLHCYACLSDEIILVQAHSDRQPSTYYRYERGSKKLSLLFQGRPWIKPQQMGKREVQSFKARDGLTVPVLVTHPPGPAKPNRPAVMLVHGGPFQRGTHWTWEPAAQFLASRGYVVIEPEFRGSMGYGYAHFKAGWKQWGLGMQDDVADAMDWAVAKGWVDAKRACIAGASYGGYATLMGLIRHSDRYRCGISWIGVTDIDLLYSIDWSDSGDAWKRYGMPRLVGDRVKDAEQLKATSPVLHAGKIRQPLILAYGGEDVRVPHKHGTEFYDAVKRQNSRVEWLFYPREGHGWRNLETNVDFWGRVEKLLASEIGGGTP